MTLVSCDHTNEPEDPTTPTTTEEGGGGTTVVHSDEYNDDIVYSTDTSEWHVYIAATSVLYGDNYSVKSPYHIPTKGEGQVLKTIKYGDGKERFVTCDGYTFGMPSPTVSKAGAKTKYSVLGIWIRTTVYKYEF